LNLDIVRDVFISVSGPVLRASAESPVQWRNGLCTQGKKQPELETDLPSYLVPNFRMNRVLPLFLFMSLRLGVEAHEHLYLFFPSVLFSLVHLFVLWGREIFPPGVIQPQLEASILTSSVLTLQIAFNFTLVFRYVLTYRCFSTPTPSGVLLLLRCVFLLH
jgi:hypothetical protein